MESINRRRLNGDSRSAHRNRLLSSSLTAIVLAFGGLENSASADHYSIVAQVGSPAEGTPLQSSNIYHLGNYADSVTPIISRSGRIVFKADLIGGGLTAANNSALFSAERGADGTDDLRLISQEGQSIGSEWPGVTVSGQWDLQTSYDGKVGYRATLLGAGVVSSNSNSYWVYDGEQSHLAARGGSFMGSALGAVSDFKVEGILSGSSTQVSSSPLASFKAVRAGYPSEFSLFNFQTGSLSTLAAVNAMAPAVPEALTGTVLRRESGGAGRGIIYSSLTGSGITSANDKIIYLTQGDALDVAARLGSATPGIPGSVFSAFGFTTVRPKVNRAGAAAFTANFSGALTGSGVWRALRTAGTPVTELLVKSGDAAVGPNLAEGVAFSAFDVTPVAGIINNLEIGNDAQNSVALIARLEGSGIDATNDRSLWLIRSPTSKVLVAQGGQSVAPGMTLENESIARDIILNRHGELVFTAQVRSGGSTGVVVDAIFKYSQGVLRMLAWGNQRLEGQTDSWIRQVRFNPGLQFNDLGQVAFVGTLAGTESDSAGAPTLFRIDQNGHVGVVASTGHRFTVADGIVRAVSSWGYSVQSGLSDTGEIVFVSNLLDAGQSGSVWAIVRVLIEPEAAPRPPADFNNDGAVTLQDLFDFLNAWFSLSAEGDFNADGAVTVQDVFDFLTAYYS